MVQKMSERRKRNKRPRLSSEESDSSSMSSSRSSSSSSSSSEDEIDAKDLKPIEDYLTNRKELAAQLFKSVKIEKIKLMLPQILKKVDLVDLEELCATELTGMSKKRIMCILKGQELLQSSDTDDTDDSGPSLEIISDTEWISDDDTIKVEGKNNKGSKKSKKKPIIKKEHDQKPKRKGKDGKSNVKVKLEKVKTEGKEKAKEKEKDKEGESILDLLELEMRARAIRALIRKEEDSSDPNAKNGKPTDTATAASGSGTSNDSSKARQADLKEQLEKIDVLMKHGEDEDVYVVINPAPTIELLSSESENEKENKKANETTSKRVNQKFASERKSESENVKEKESGNKDKPSTIKEPDKENVNKDKTSINKEKDESSGKDVGKDKSADNEGSKTQEKDKIEKTKGVSNEKQSSNLPMSVIENDEKDKPEGKKEPPKPEDLEDGEILDDEEDKAASKEKDKPVEESPKKIKKIKKNPNTRARNKSKERESNKKRSAKAGASETNKPISDADKIISKMTQPADSVGESIEIADSPPRTENASKTEERRPSKDDIFDDKALDIEEIINLDDYPDDIDDLESAKEVSKLTAESSSKETDKSKEDSDTHSSETWASRYYQQDDVKNVIKESKIQSEIRKRLRERQKQNKLNNSPKELEATTPEPVVVPKPIGSVEEYLALKGISTDTSSDVPDDKVDSVESEKISDAPSAEAKENEDSSSNEKTVDSNLPQITQVKVISKPIVIRRKPQLNENIVSTSKVENLTVEKLSKVLKCDEILNKAVQEPNKTKDAVSAGQKVADEKEIVEKEIALPPDTDKKEISTPAQTAEQMMPSPVKINKEERASTANTGKEEGTLPATPDEQKISSAKTEETTLNTSLNTSFNTSDSSEDNVVVKIDNSFWTQKLGESNRSTQQPKQEEKTAVSDSDTSELRPD